MDMTGNRPLAVTQQQAWDALNNPDVLKVCIPGCDKIESTGQDQYDVGVAVKVGPVSAKFGGKIALSDIKAPHSYTLNFEGQGGAAGFSKGTSSVTLTPQSTGTGCELAYTVHASVGGKIAQLGQRLIDGAAKNMAEDFFKRFDNEMQRQYPEAYAVQAQNNAQALADGDAKDGGTPLGTATPAGAKVPTWAWIAAGVIVLALLWSLRS